MLDRITPVILARDEEANIGRTLAQLAWAKEVVVVDSLSTDRTVPIARQFPNVRVVERAFDSHDRQWTFAVELVKTPWVLTLDADYFVPAAFVRELESLNPPPDIVGYEAAFIYAVGGHPLRASLYPPRAVVLRRGAFDLWQDGHTQRLRLRGRVERLRTRLIHDDRKNLKRFMERQRVYMSKEAEKLRAASFSSLNTVGKLRKLRVIAPPVVAAYVLIVQRTLFDGPKGWRYTWERFLAELTLSRELWRTKR